MSELNNQHEKWKAARERLHGKPKVIELVPPTKDPAADVMDIIIAAVANSLSISATEIMRGHATPDTISARKLAIAMCVRHPRFSVERVSEYFEVSETTVEKAVSALDPILDSYVITRRTPLELSLPLVAKEWCTVESFHRRRPSMEAILGAVSDVFTENTLDILSERRNLETCRARHVAIALCKHLTVKSYPEIGRFFNGRDHTTVMHSCKKFAPIYEEIRLKVSPAATPEMWATMALEQLTITPFGPGLTHKDRWKR